MLNAFADLQASCSRLHPSLTLGVWAMWHSAWLSGHAAASTDGLQAHDEQLPGAHAADRQTPDKVRNQEQAGVAARRLGESQKPRQPVPQMDAPDTKPVRGSAEATTSLFAK